MSGSQTGNYFEDDTEDGKFTISLFEDPNAPGDLKMEVRLNGIATVLMPDRNGLALRPSLDKRLALRVAHALWGWYATEEMLQDAAFLSTEEDQ